VLPNLVLPLAGRRVLLVEDDEDACFLLAEGLTRQGAEALSACSGSEALELLTQHRPDVLVSDLDLPGMPGIELIQRVRSHPGLDQLPGIALTGHGGEAHREAAFRAGFSKHLLKPTKMSDLVVAILAVELRAERPTDELPRDIRELLALLSQASPCRFTSLLRFAADDTLSSVWTHDRDNPEVDPFPLGLPIHASYCVLIRETGKACAIEDARTDPRTTVHPKRAELATYIGVPLRRADGQLFGTLCSYDSEPLRLAPSVLDALEKATQQLEGRMSTLLGLETPARPESVRRRER
jgi:CheY-like chemotaxis protein